MAEATSKAAEQAWTRPDNRLPERGQVVDWISYGGDQITGGKYDNLWFLPCGVYVYYTPEFWRPSTTPKGGA